MLRTEEESCRIIGGIIRILFVGSMLHPVVQVGEWRGGAQCGGGPYAGSGHRYAALCFSSAQPSWDEPVSLVRCMMTAGT